MSELNEKDRDAWYPGVKGKHHKPEVSISIDRVTTTAAVTLSACPMILITVCGNCTT